MKEDAASTSLLQETLGVQGLLAGEDFLGAEGLSK